MNDRTPVDPAFLPAPVSGTARRVHARGIVADAHNDLLMSVVRRPAASWGEFFRRRWLPQLRAGGVSLQILPVFVSDAYRNESALRETIMMIECAHVLAEANADSVALCTTGAELDDAMTSGRIALVLALESAPGVGEDIALFSTVHRLGVRVASIAHFGRSPLADGSYEATGSRLTAPGVAALREMERLGITFDVSHLNATGIDHVLELATRPVLATHSAAAAIHPHHRNLSDIHLRGIAATGGVVCVNFYAPHLHDSDSGVGRLVEHIEHIVEVAGIEHVGLGPDFVEEVLADTTPPGCEPPGVVHYLNGLHGPSGLPFVTQALLDAGLDEGSVGAVLGGNLHRFLVRALAEVPALR